ERTGGELTSIDIDPKMVQTAREHIQNMGLEKTVKVVEGDALKVLPALDGEFDFIFIDALKQDYLKYFKAVETKLKTGAVIVADNVIQSKNAMKDFLDYFNNNPDYDALTVICSEEKGDGMMVIYKVK
ncbi:MAG TPA: class I SAM-dependent methyltransferase, partial [bacterium]|nr:class I SAM-dependent methyltransferase [bacterium]